MFDWISCFALAAPLGLLDGRSPYDPMEHPTKGALQYKGYDKDGNAVVHGWLFLDVRESADIDGEWYLERVGEPGDIGPQLGLGPLRGRREGTNLYVNLNPSYAELNVLLSGTYNGTTYKGKWSYSTIRGLAKEGTFEAARVEKTASASRAR